MSWGYTWHNDSRKKSPFFSVFLMHYDAFRWRTEKNEQQQRGTNHRGNYCTFHFSMQAVIICIKNLAMEKKWFSGQRPKEKKLRQTENGILTESDDTLKTKQKMCRFGNRSEGQKSHKAQDWQLIVPNRKKKTGVNSHLKKNCNKCSIKPPAASSTASSSSWSSSWLGRAQGLKLLWYQRDPLI